MCVLYTPLSRQWDVVKYMTPFHFSGRVTWLPLRFALPVLAKTPPSQLASLLFMALFVCLGWGECLASIFSSNSQKPGAIFFLASMQCKLTDIIQVGEFCFPLRMIFNLTHRLPWAEARQLLLKGEKLSGKQCCVIINVLSFNPLSNTVHIKLYFWTLKRAQGSFRVNAAV